MTARLDLSTTALRFYGWARQDGQRTVQAEVEAALGRILGREVPLTVAGRTDRGVHATGQVASYEGPALRAEALNALLPPDVAVRTCVEAPDGFDARRDALSRSYRYRVFASRERSAFEAGRALFWPRRLDRELLHACAALLPGKHEFTAFTPTETYHTRFTRNLLLARWVEDGPQLAFEIEADSFMRHMNRVLVGTMLQVAQGRRDARELRLAARRRAPA